MIRVEEFKKSSPPPDFENITIGDLMAELKARFNSLVIAGTYIDEEGQDCFTAEWWGPATSAIGLASVVKHDALAETMKRET